MNYRLSMHAISRHDGRRARSSNADRRHRLAGDAIPVRYQAHLRPLLHLSVLAAALLLSGPSSARDHAAPDVGRWSIAPSGDREGCFLTRTYQGPRETTLLFGLDADDSNRLTILNANWSIKEKEQLRLNFRLSNASFPRHLSIGIAADDKKGFVTSFGAAFPGTFAASTSLHIARGDVPVEELSLDGSGAAVQRSPNCVTVLTACAARRP